MTTRNIATLRTEAAQAGDTAQVELCDLALAGDEAAQAECLDVIYQAYWQAVFGDLTPETVVSEYDLDPALGSLDEWLGAAEAASGLSMPWDLSVYAHERALVELEAARS